jgi:pyrrolidone-carboxylate peptidase
MNEEEIIGWVSVLNRFDVEKIKDDLNRHLEKCALAIKVLEIGMATGKNKLEKERISNILEVLTPDTDLANQVITLMRDSNHNYYKKFVPETYEAKKNELRAMLGEILDPEHSLEV